jgi:hypothetical protein
MKGDRWGYIDAREDAALAKVAKAFSKKVKTTDNPEDAVCKFMRAYLKIGDDPTDTVVRDNVWEFLLRATNRKIKEERLDAIWKEEVKASRSVLACVIS